MAHTLSLGIADAFLWKARLGLCGCTPAHPWDDLYKTQCFSCFLVNFMCMCCVCMHVVIVPYLFFILFFYEFASTQPRVTLCLIWFFILLLFLSPFIKPEAKVLLSLNFQQVEHPPLLNALYSCWYQFWVLRGSQYQVLQFFSLK